MAEESNGGAFGKILGTALAGALAGGGVWLLERKVKPAQAAAEPKPEPRLAEFRTACDILNLPHDREFTLEEMKGNAKLLILKVHPDTDPNERHKAKLTAFAQRINWAQQVIVQNKGWATV